MSKPYIQKDLNDPTKLKVEYRSKPDRNTICPAPEGEEIEWLDIVDLIDETSSQPMGKQAVVNEQRKTQVLTSRAQKKLERDQEREAKRLKKIEVAENFKKLYPNALSKVAEIKQYLIVLHEAIDQMREALGLYSIKQDATKVNSDDVGAGR